MEMTMRSLFAALYSTIAYLVFLGAFLYAIGFVQNLQVPKSIDSGEAGNPLVAFGINLALLTVFALQHSVMARPAFKRVWTRIVPEEAERSTYVLAASLALVLLYWQWRPIAGNAWSITDPILAALIMAVSWMGWAMVLISTFLISHFHLFGLSQGFAKLLGLKGQDGAFRTPLFYKLMRHPIYAGFIIAFWAAPLMSWGHLLFAAATTGYILIGIRLEERDLIAQFGERYRQYRRQVGMLFPKFGGQRDRRGVS
jgi:methanethiol S-methyltransferase